MGAFSAAPGNGADRELTERRWIMSCLETSDKNVRQVLLSSGRFLLHKSGASTFDILKQIGERAGGAAARPHMMPVMDGMDDLIIAMGRTRKGKAILS